MMFLRLGTAVDILIGPFLDVTDAATAETGETPTVKVSKNGQALAAKSDVTVPIHDADGYYNCELDTTDTGTLGQLVVTVAATASALAVRHEFQVLPQVTYDALFDTAGTDYLPVDVFQLGGVTQSAADLKDFADQGYDPVTNKVQGVVLVDTTTTNTDMRGTDSALLASSAPTNFGALGITVGGAVSNVVAVGTLTGHTAQTGDSFARLGAPAGASVSADIAAVKVDTAATLADTGTDGVVIASATQDAIADALLDRADAIEVGLTLRQALRLQAAAAAGKLSGAATTTATLRNAVADTKNRIVATVDADGNRSAIVYDLT